MPEEGIHNYPLGELTKLGLHQSISQIGKLVRGIGPDIIFISAGFDGHCLDPVGGYLGG